MRTSFTDQRSELDRLASKKTNVPWNRQWHDHEKKPRPLIAIGPRRSRNTEIGTAVLKQHANWPAGVGQSSPRIVLTAMQRRTHRRTPLTPRPATWLCADGRQKGRIIDAKGRNIRAFEKGHRRGPCIHRRHPRCRRRQWFDPQSAEGGFARIALRKTDRRTDRYPPFENRRTRPNNQQTRYQDLSFSNKVHEAAGESQTCQDCTTVSSRCLGRLAFQNLLQPKRLRH